MGAMKVWDGTTWQTVAPFSERASVYVGPNAPAGTAYAGDLWWDTDDTMAVAGQELAYSQVAANVNVTSTAIGAPNLVIASAPTTYDGSPITVEFYSAALQSGTSQLNLQLWDGATDIGFLSCSTGTVHGSIKRRLTPAPGSHTYRVMGYVSTTVATCYAGNGGVGAFPPMSIRVTRV